MSFIDTDDPFSIAAKRIRSSVIRSTPEPQLPIQGKQQPTTYIIEPDLMESQTGKMNLPNDVAFDDAGFAYNTVTGNPVQVVRRPNVLPITKTPDGFTPVMPKVLDIVGNVMGNVGGLAGGKVAANAGELVLGSGAVRTAIKTPKITAPFKKVGLTTLDNYLKANNIPFKKDISKSIGSLSSYYYIDTPTGIKKLRVSDHIGGVGEHANFPLGSSSEEAFNKINEFLGTSLTPEKFDNFKNSLKLEIEDNLKEWQDAKASKKYDSYGPYDYDRPINIFKNQLALFSDTRPQVAAPAVATKAGEVVLGSGAVRKSLDESLITKAKEHFGITKEPKEAGYVLPDGSMLDLSGRHYATGYENINGRFVPKAGQPDYLKGTRSVDHREVADITDVGGTEGMRQFMNKTGAIRNQPGNGIDTTVIPTDQQLNRLISSHNSSYRGEPFTVDISNPITGENIASKTFEKPNVEKIKKWIADETAKYPTLYSDTRPQVYSQIGHQFEKNQPFHSALERTVDNAKKAKEGFPLFSSTPITTPVDYDPFNNNKKYKLTPIEGNPFQ